MMDEGILKKHVSIQKEESGLISNYFKECLPTIDDNNLYMLRKVCMYVSFVYIIMLVVADILLEKFKISVIYLLLIPLIIIYFFINLYTMNHRGQISTAKTAAICCTYYFFLGVILGLIDVFESPAGQAIWLPIAVMALPMIYIDHVYKYGFEELVVLSIMLIMSYNHKTRIEFIHDLYISISAFLISMLSARIILSMRAKEALAMQEVTRLSALDKLTQVLNKGALIQRIENYYVNKAEEEPSAMCIIDLDDFKYVNDNLGHATGDLLLESVGRILKDNFRAYDIVGRYGGDEFVVVMPKMPNTEILKMRCETVQRLISALDYGNKQPFTASIGAILNKGTCNGLELFSMADDALYNAKIFGKNQCTVWENDKLEIAKSIVLMLANDSNLIEKMDWVNNETVQLMLAEDDNRFIQLISEYRKNVKAIVLVCDVKHGIGIMALKYVKTRESFEKVPVIAICDEKSELIEKADAVLATDTPSAVFKKSIEKLIGY